MLKLCNAVYWLALTIWTAALIAVGVAAFFTFTTLRHAPLDLHLGAYSEYDPAQHWRIAAGYVTEPIFTLADIVQVPAALLVLVTFVLQVTVFRMRWRLPANAVRGAAVVLAAILLAARIVFFMPEMNRDLRAYRSAAQVGQVETAERHLAAFNVNHRRTRPMMNGSLVLLLIAVAASGAAMSSQCSPKLTRELQQPKSRGKA